MIWRGLSRLTDIELGAAIGQNFMGNWKSRRTLTANRMKFSFQAL